MKDAELTIGVKWKVLVMGDSIHETRMGTLPESTHKERAHLSTREVLSVDVDMSRTEDAEGDIRIRGWCRHRQSPSHFKITPPRDDVNVQLTAVGRRIVKDLNIVPTNEHHCATTRV